MHLADLVMDMRYLHLRQAHYHVRLFVRWLSYCLILLLLICVIIFQLCWLARHTWRALPNSVSVSIQNIERVAKVVDYIIPIVNRSLWAMWVIENRWNNIILKSSTSIYGQLTLGRFKGNTAFTWVVRVISTFLGCFTGMATWYVPLSIALSIAPEGSFAFFLTRYMSTGTGDGNALGLAAVAAVCYPVYFFIRLYFPATPVTLSSYCVSLALVIGFSWQDTHYPNLSTSGTCNLIILGTKLILFLRF